ncbi:putative glucan endo-1,3-beta-glucosidase GVI [Elaeis guineensis]|uniref:putative glucan endo-1,3-beta-glucosidase GVI n=1 Tax=Elaeis guineensis var. tenera TaxID=51953 RepID=UPI003C6D4D29
MGWGGGRDGAGGDGVGEEAAGNDGDEAGEAVAASTSFHYIIVGNEVIPGNLASCALSTMQNLNTALIATKLNIPISTAIATNVFDMPFPPSQGAFSEASSADMTGIAGFLASKKTPLLVNVYPYFAYANQPKDMQLNYALFTAKGMVVVDGSLNYANRFDAMYSALEKARHTDVSMVV